MGGYGSGPYGHMGSKTGKVATSQCLRLDVRKMKRDGILTPGMNVTWSWTRSNGKESSIGIKTILEDEIRLNYTATIDGESTPIETRIRLDYSSCNYGNKRPWFSCPRCYARVAVLFLKGLHFCCRSCHDLTYYTCQESGNLNNMAIRRVNRVLANLKSDERCGFDILYYVPRRPRYMHGKTYQRLLRQYNNKQIEYANSIRGKLAAFKLDARDYVDIPDAL